MSTKTTVRRVRSQYEVIKAHRRKHSVHAMCRLLGVAQADTTPGLRSRCQTMPKRTPDCFV